MWKAAAAAGAAVLAGLGALTALDGHLPVGWAEGAALAFTGAALIGASLVLESPRPAEDETETGIETSTSLSQRGQKAHAK
jgi:hypothetical protein